MATNYHCDANANYAFLDVHYIYIYIRDIIFLKQEPAAVA